MTLRHVLLCMLAMCVTLTAVPAVADVYNNGPINGNIDAWTINAGFAISDTFLVGSSGATVTGLNIATWLFPGDVMTSAEVSITSEEFGGTTFFDGVVNFSQSGCTANSFGFDVCGETGSFNATLAAGSYWLTLQNATDTGDEPVYWDENDGPSFASDNSVGTLPSESFTILGNGSGGGTTPEPSSIMLLSSGILGVTGLLRCKRF
jgi:hypothetical protein